MVEHETKHQILSVIDDIDQDVTVEPGEPVVFTSVPTEICEPLKDIVKEATAVVCTQEMYRHMKSEPGEMYYTLETNTSKIKPEVIPIPSNDQIWIQQDETLVKLGASYASMEEVGDVINKLTVDHLRRFVCYKNALRKHISIPDKRSVIYKCCFGIGRKSQSQGRRQSTSQYVGCPAGVRVLQQNDGALMVVKCVLEHKEHEVSKEAYANMRRKLSNDQEEAVTALLETNPLIA